MSCPEQYLDGAVAAVDPDPVAAVQEHGGVAASDDGGDSEFAGYDSVVGDWRCERGRGEGRPRARAGAGGGGGGEQGHRALCGGGGDEDLALTELGGVLGR